MFDMSIPKKHGLPYSKAKKESVSDYWWKLSMALECDDDNITNSKQMIVLHVKSELNEAVFSR